MKIGAQGRMSVSEPPSARNVIDGVNQPRQRRQPMDTHVRAWYTRNQ